MPSHLALLRGINVGGHHKVPMARLRDLVTGLGHGDVASYIQSGNLVLTPAGDPSPAELGASLRAAIDEEFGFAPLVVVLTAEQWTEVVEDNPYPDVVEPRQLHATVQQDALDAEQVCALQRLQEHCREAGGRDELTVVGRVCYLHTPDGFGASLLAEKLGRVKATGQDRATARNWATVLRLREILRQG